MTEKSISTLKGSKSTKKRGMEQLYMYSFCKELQVRTI